MQLTNVTVQKEQHRILDNLNWTLNRGESWTLLGTNASGKSTLARLLTQELGDYQGSLDTDGKRVEWVSLESQQALYERELYRDDTDFMDHLDEGTPVKALLEEITPWSTSVAELCDKLHLGALLQRGYRMLSTGEGRRVMLARSLLSQPDLLILDEPFEGLDAQSRDDLHRVLNELIDHGQGLLLLVNQRADIASHCTHLALLDKGQLLFTGAMPDDLEAQWQHLLSVRHHDVQLPDRQSGYQLDTWQQEQPLVELVDGFVQYDDTFQFQQFNWQLKPGVHTHIQGPNGCGKSTLLGLITGDHPQCYRNNLTVLGFKRGQGESIWQIKKHLGYVSGNLHRDYRVSGNALTAVISGLTDSIGVYQAVGETEKELALQWLQLIGLADKWNAAFKSLSMGEQRLVLIARALIKQPPLLILDEPTQGLDDFNRFYVLSIVEKILANGPTTLLFVSHRQDESMSCIKQRLIFEEDARDGTLFSITAI
ncbi:molybdate ABC transporter ATP-binding protein ModF [Reinekea sp. G2M2-21]|uniref:molybdate ABC transporter ATP-binding protein ModF n=1 Tax=Reinekea sp. G2M2-21 TaxID=2788942 RepID=UPI0018ABAF12|nr:molybdate ABC transporter ATP-binding protein ModF [Reinekea sp. G2M2-21]